MSTGLSLRILWKHGHSEVEMGLEGGTGRREWKGSCLVLKITPFQKVWYELCLILDHFLSLNYELTSLSSMISGHPWRDRWAVWLIFHQHGIYWLSERLGRWDPLPTYLWWAFLTQALAASKGKLPPNKLYLQWSDNVQVIPVVCGFSSILFIDMNIYTHATWFYSLAVLLRTSPTVF